MRVLGGSKLFFSMFITFVLLTNLSEAQISMIGGMNVTGINDQGYISNNSADFGVHLGTVVQYNPFGENSKFSLKNCLIYNNKGYAQNLDKKYHINLNYISFTGAVNFSIANDFSIDLGVEYARLFEMFEIRRVIQTYTNHDFGLLFGMNFLDSKMVSIHLIGTYGLTPMLTYYSFDEYGNFIDQFKGIRNICLSVGMSVKLFNDEIVF